MGKPKRTRAEALLETHRKKPSPTCHDPRQLDLTDFISRQAFANLDREIERVLRDEKQAPKPTEK